MTKDNNKPISEMKDRMKEALQYCEKKPADMSKDLNIPKSAISQYLSGKSKKMDTERMYDICVYLNVNEAWLMGYDVPMERFVPNNKENKEVVSIKKEDNDIMADIIVRMRIDNEFLSLVESLYPLNKDQIISVQSMLNAFIK